MNQFTIFNIFGLLLILFSFNVMAAQDYNSSRSNNDGVAVDNLDAELDKMLRKIHKDLSAKYKKRNMRQKGKDSDSYRDVTVTLKAKISPSGKTRAQDYNSSRSNNINAAVPNFDGQLTKYLSKMKKEIVQDFHQKNKSGKSTGLRAAGKSSKKTPDSFFDIWVEVSIKERPISRKTQH